LNTKYQFTVRKVAFATAALEQTRMEYFLRQGQIGFTLCSRALGSTSSSIPF